MKLYCCSVIRCSAIGMCWLMLLWGGAQACRAQCEDVLASARTSLARADYQKAINLLQYAQEICPESQGEEVNRLVRLAFERIQGERDEAIRQQRIARGQALAAQSAFAFSQRDYNRSFWLAAQSWKQTASTEARQAMIRSVYGTSLRYQDQQIFFPFYRDLLTQQPLVNAGFITNDSIWAVGKRSLKLVDGEGSMLYERSFPFEVVQAELDPVSKALYLVKRWDNTAVYRASWEGPTQRLDSLGAPITALTLKHEAGMLALGAKNGEMALYDLQAQRLRPLAGHQDSLMQAPAINGLAFGSRGRYLYAASDDKTGSMWSVRSGSLRTRVYPLGLASSTVPNSSLGCLQLLPSPKRDYWLLTQRSSSDPAIGVFDKTGKFIRSIRGHTEQVNDVCISEDGRYILSASSDQQIKLFEYDGWSDDLDGRVREVMTLVGHEGYVKGVRFSRDGRYVLSFGGDGSLKRWDVHGFRPQGHAVTKGVLAPLAATATPDGQWMGLAFRDGSLRTLHRTDSGWQAWDPPVPTSTGPLMASRAMPFMLASEAGDVFLAKAKDSVLVCLFPLRRQLKVLRQGQGEIYCGAISRQRTLAVYEEGTGILLWDGNGVLRDSIPLSTALLGMAFSPDGHTLYVAGSTRLYSMSLVGAKRELRPLWEYPENTLFSILACAPDGSHLALGTFSRKSTAGSSLSLIEHAGGSIHLLRTDGSLLRTIRAHKAQLSTLELSSGADLILSSSRDGSIKLFNRQGEEIGTFVDQLERNTFVLSARLLTGLTYMLTIFAPSVENMNLPNVYYWPIAPEELIRLAREKQVGNPLEGEAAQK